MKKINRKLLAALSLAILIGWLLWPAYQFFAYNKGSMPLPPFGWLKLPDDGPSVQEIYDPDYSEAAKLSLTVLEKHRKKLQRRQSPQPFPPVAAWYGRAPAVGRISSPGHRSARQPAFASAAPPRR
ncbi:hypothetical protein [Microbulbifer taiwanensis]|uniref:hypothetical protein n=1 Tax=Microbulbifer taiwanensis TaxID=986746 RepID=UPI0036123812